MKLYASIVLLLLILPASNSSKSTRKRVAIVGGGIGGAALAFYTNKWSTVPLEIVVFEQENRVGGRLAHANVGGHSVNVGGDAWSPTVNRYVAQLAAELNVSAASGFSSGNGLLALFDGVQFVRNATEFVLRDRKSDAAMAVALASVAETLALNYAERGANVSFDSVDEFLRYGHLNRFTQRSTRRYLHAELGIGERWLSLTVEPLGRVIYDQTLQMQSFAGMVSVLSVAAGAESAAGGNDVLVQRLLEASGATLRLGTRVTSIDSFAPSPSSPSGYTVEYGAGKREHFDAVSVAAPLEFADIALPRGTPALAPRHFEHWYVFVVEARRLRPSYFGGVDPVPDSMLTLANSTAPFVKISVEFESKTNAGYRVYSIFANADMSDALLDAIFEQRIDTSLTFWPYTFPNLTASAAAYQPIVLDSDAQRCLFYQNTLESVASAMETSAIAARNVALLIEKNRCLL
jgi:prenylcysteine oxidase / farnesylcysteine lyase